MPKLLVKETTHYVGNGCSCCEPDELSAWNVYVDGEDKYIQGVDVETALYFFLEELGYDITIEEEEKN